MKKTLKAEYNFHIDSANNSHYITYSKDKFGAGLGCGLFILMGIFSGFLISIFSIRKASSSFIFWMMLTLGLTFLVLYLIKKSRKDKTFVIGEDFIAVNDISYDLADIKKIYIKDPKGNLHRSTNNSSSGFVFVGRGAMGAAAVGAASMASSGAKATSEIMNNAIHKASYKIEFLYGNKKVALAKGLSENNAIVLYDKVLELLDMTSK